MVTAILIPIVCIYFYLVTVKEMKASEKKWLNLTQLHEEAIVSGQIIQLVETKKRFYYHRYIHVIDIQLQTEMKTIYVSRITPYMKHHEALPFKVGDDVRLFGNWQENKFRFLRFDVVHK